MLFKIYGWNLLLSIGCGDRLTWFTYVWCRLSTNKLIPRSRQPLRLTIAEALALLEEPSNGGDVHMDLPHNIELFEGDKDASDDEAVGSSVRLKGELLETDTQVSCQQDICRTPCPAVVRS
ncbi:uncharacterized protein LOC128249687 [Octopus bimaculoides]|uniref:uncharacterized protein LOC128249687 n=1 Tax=Octopus bimaculoides TaxID=37653 RepID=UPI0022E68E5C|nr:uncharacterized protein LOC128249687 [Octopus bimaculoides]